MRAEFSEFTYGFSLVSEFASSLNCNAAPIFPSLKKEGQAGGGYDVKMDVGAVPFFLQFKLSEYLKSSNAKEAKHSSGYISSPYRRFQITASVTSNQHSMLLGLEAKNQHVYYCAPNFHTNDELNKLWVMRSVSDFSVFVHPSEIGIITDVDKHAVCFDATSLGQNKCYLFSDPKPIESLTLETLRSSIATSLKEANTPLRDLLPKWEKQLDEAQQEGEWRHREYISLVEKLRSEKQLKDRLAQGRSSPEENISFLRRNPIVITQSERDELTARFLERREPATDPETKLLFNLGRRAATEFQSQLFVLQPKSKGN